MSSTMTLTMNTLPPPRLSTIPCCPKCGTDLSLTTFLPAGTGDSDSDEAASALRAAQRQIEDLQAQVLLLNQKATAAVDRWADYEDELSGLRRELSAQKQRNDSVVTSGGTGTGTGAGTRPQTPTVSSPARSRSSIATASPGAVASSLATAATNRISALLGSRKSQPNLKAAAPGGHHQMSLSASNFLPTPSFTPFPAHSPSKSTSSLLPTRSPLHLSLSSGDISYMPGHSPTPSTDDLIEALSREQKLRLAAEGKLNDTSREVEELSVQLFEEANTMVATERRARARLEERVGELEKREKEKKRRLERLEGAMGRIERVRALLEEQTKVDHLERVEE